VLQELVRARAVRVGTSSRLTAVTESHQEMQHDLRSWQPLGMQDASWGFDQRAQDEWAQRNMDVLWSLAVSLRASLVLTTAAGSRRHADGCMQLVHAPADGCDLRHEAKQGRTVVASCTGVPGSRVRGWNAMEQRTFLDMITS